MAKRKKEVQEVQLEIQTQKAIGEVSYDAYKEYGSYVNNHRHMCKTLDGLKPSYKRLIWSSLQYPRGKDIPSTALINNVATWHPHGLSGIEELNANLTKAGVFSGEGSFGSVGIDGVVNPHAAPRYTKNRLSDLYHGIISDLVKEVPMIESPVGPLEPEYIPLPIPLCLYLKTQVSGLGVGAKCDYPSFSPQSLYMAYINNDPLLLEPSIDILLDKQVSELSRLWETGKGSITYSYKISRQLSPDGKAEGILFEGDTGIFTPKLSKFEKLESEGKVFIEDMTDQTGPKLFIGRVPGARGITIEEVESLARKICHSSVTYNLNVTDGNTTFRTPMKDWLDYTYKNYINLLVQVNTKKINKTVFDIAVQEAIPVVSNYILNVNPKATDNEIVKNTELSIEVVSTVMSKPISYLRKNKDTSDRIKSLKAKLKELKRFDPVLFTESVISKM